MAAAGAGAGREDRGSAGAGGRESCVPHFDALWFCYCAPPAPPGPLPLPGRPCLGTNERRWNGDARSGA